MFKKTNKQLYKVYHFIKEYLMIFSAYTNKIECINFKTLKR